MNGNYLNNVPNSSANSLMANTNGYLYEIDANFTNVGNAAASVASIAHSHHTGAHKIDFYTSRISPYCRAVKMLATHLNIPLNEIYIRPYIDTQTDEYKKINPCHTVPALNDNGFVLWESRAIMQYLCNKYAPDSPLYPKDPQMRATVDRLLNFDLKTLSHAVISAHFEFTLPNEYSASRSDKFLELTDSLTFLEIFLINKDYVAGDTLTIADISLLANVTLLEIAVEFDLSSFSNIWGWFNRLRRELPYYDRLTKIAHDEYRELIKNIRDAHEEWSAAHFCAFCPCDQHDGHLHTNGF
ncbi:glutathione S-transferase 1-like [Oppia nitens]|uniref:glutathione S-transferase 1-like n=1 Tax=Oppia nitens TaxID=1686743 RepID=UPI0023DB286E|nr:glutathione S-transferase 1-like [Oppia nitens]